MKNKIFLKFLLTVFAISIPTTFLLISLRNINDYGETTDEKFDQHIGEFYYYDWPKQGLSGLNQRFIELQRNYGPFFDYIAVASHDILYTKLGIIKNPVASYHFPVILVSTLAIIFVFLFSFLNWGYLPAIFSALTMTLLPRFIGDSQNNLKDTPLMAFFLISIFFFFLGLQTKKIVWFILGGISTGITYTIKINGLLILPVIIPWAIGATFKNRRETSKTLLYLSLGLGVSLATILVVWPYYRYETIPRFVETFLTFKNHVWNEYILYLGQHYRGHEVPWHYPLVLFGVTTPVFYLFFGLLGLFLTSWNLIKKSREGRILLLLILWFSITPIAQVLSGAPKYDGIRHYLVSVPPLSILIGYAITKLGNLIGNQNGKFRMIFLSIYWLFIMSNFLFILVKDIQIHPYQIVYFNELTGGVRGARGKFDLDYWGQSLKQTAEWINNNLPNNSKIMLTLPMYHHFPVDQKRFYFVDTEPVYKINLIRGMLKSWDVDEDYLNPKGSLIYAVNVDGANILEIHEFPENKEVDDLTKITSLSSRVNYHSGVKVTVKDQLGETTTISNEIGFDCQSNLYNEKPVKIAYSGLISINHESSVCFKLYSDDEATVILSNQKLIVNPSMRTSLRNVSLESGFYPFNISYENNVGAACLNLLWSTSGDCRDTTMISSSQLFYDETKK